MFPDDLLALAIEEFGGQVVASIPLLVQPLPCDRYVARSALQKAIRRGETQIALRALTALLAAHPTGVWRALTIIALEDVGVGCFDAVTVTVAAARNRAWRHQAGGDWAVASRLVREMADGAHCQAACDLLMVAVNDPVNEGRRVGALDLAPGDLVARLVDERRPIIDRVILALALGGGLAEGQPVRQPHAAFHALGLAGISPYVIETCHAAWRASRNEMAFTLPLAWQAWSEAGHRKVEDDDWPSSRNIDGVPAYAFDQFTRGGRRVLAFYLAASPTMRDLLFKAGVPAQRHSSVAGDLLFLAEGGKAVRRPIWDLGEMVRTPSRPLRGAFDLPGHFLPAGVALMAAQGSLIDDLREEHLSHQ